MNSRISQLFEEPPDEPPQQLLISKLKVLLQRQASILTNVSTIQSASDDFDTNDAVLRSNFDRLGIEYPFPWTDLWDWYGHYSGTTTRYRERRVLIRTALKPALDALQHAEQASIVSDSVAVHEPTWIDINTRITRLIAEMGSADDRDSWQDVGRRSREILIDLVGLIADPSLVPDGQEVPQAANVKVWYDLFVAQFAAGASRDDLRKLLRATWDLANKVTHGDIDKVDAYASAQATILLVRATQMLISEHDARSDAA